MNESTKTPDLTEVYMKLKQIHYAMDLAIDDLHDCLKYPQGHAERIALDKQLIIQQQEEVWRCSKMLEQIAPEDCLPDLLYAW